MKRTRKSARHTILALLIGGFACGSSVHAEWKVAATGQRFWNPFEDQNEVCMVAGETTPDGLCHGSTVILYLRGGELAYGLTCKMNAGIPIDKGLLVVKGGSMSVVEFQKSAPAKITSIGTPAIVSSAQSQSPKNTEVPAETQPSTAATGSQAPMPQPNYSSIYGSRYTPTQMQEYRQWLNDQTWMDPAQKAARIAEQERLNWEDQQRESEWIERAYRNPFQ